MSDKIKHKPGEPYMEIMPDGNLLELIDLGEPQLCFLGLSDEEVEKINKIKK